MGKERILMGTSDLENRTKGNCSSAMDRTVKKQKQEPFILCLCAVCAAQFYHNPECRIKRADLQQEERELCMYCNVRQGFDYLITKRNQNRNRIKQASAP